jgi:D-3-phosphoglycerate dehydrogenase
MISGQEHSVFFADQFYMTDEAIKNIKKIAKIKTAEASNEDEMAEELQKIKPKVIVSEYFKISKRIINSSPSLEGIVVWGVGYDHIDVKAASEKGIFVANTRGSNAESVAEHVFSLILGLARNRKGKWQRREETGIPKALVAEDLYGKTLGIVGLGMIGSRVALMGKTFGMRVKAYDPYKSLEEAQELGAEIVSLKSLLAKSDFITIHAVLNNETREMISEEELSLMKKTAILINASRGQLINENALIDALKSGKIAGAGLDVFEKEPPGPDSPLLQIKNVILTPHVAGNSQDALDNTSLVVSQEVKRILSGQIPKNLINKQQLIQRGYIS